MRNGGNAAVSRLGARMPGVPRPSFHLPDWRKLRRRLIVVGLIICALAAAYLLWFRDSSFVAIEKVKIEGAEQAPQVESALRGAAEGQSTLHFDMGALEEAVAGDPLVAGISVETDFPSGVLVSVDIREPAGFVEADGVVLAGDGTVLERAGEAPQGVPVIEFDGKGAKPVKGGVAEGDALAAAKVLGAAPGPLAKEISAVTAGGEHGVVVEIGPGLELRFGSPGEAALKWRAAAAVLASPEFKGAEYLDLSVPKRPVAGGVQDPSETTEEVAAVEADPAAAVTADPAAPEATETAPVEPVTPAEPTPEVPVAVP